jgi:hypothetical protein
MSVRPGHYYEKSKFILCLIVGNILNIVLIVYGLVPRLRSTSQSFWLKFLSDLDSLDSRSIFIVFILA